MNKDIMLQNIVYYKKITRDCELLYYEVDLWNYIVARVSFATPKITISVFKKFKYQ